jgi:hypothetical protein
MKIQRYNSLAFNEMCSGQIKETIFLGNAGTEGAFEKSSWRIKNCMGMQSPMN